jgi:hypothetical protein
MIEDLERRLPTGTDLSGYEALDPNVVVILAEQPSIQRGMALKASVHVSREAIEDHGLDPVRAALKILGDRAMSRRLPLVSHSVAAPMLVLTTSEGTEVFDPPRSVAADR